MAKQPGFPFAVLVDDAASVAQTISNDVTNHNFATPRGVQDVTGVDKSAMERILLLADFSVTLNGVFNPSPGASHSVLSTVPSTSVARTCSLTLSSQQLAPETLFTDYALTRNQDGSFTWTTPGVLADGTVPTWAVV